MTKVVTAVFTNRKLNIFQLSEKKNDTFSFLTELDLKPGDMLSSDEFDTDFEVFFVKEKVWTDDIDRGLRFVKINKINGKKNLDNYVPDNDYYTINTSKSKKSSKGMNTNSNAMFSGMLGKYKSQFIPERESSVRMSMTGLLVVPVNGEYVGIDANNKLMSFPEEMTISIPVYSINKLNSAVQVGDIVKNGTNTYAKVVGKNTDGSLKVLTYTGYTRSKKEVVDFFVNQATTRVLINMFNFDNSENSFNPLFFAFANGDHFDVNSLLMLSMTPQGRNLFSNAGGGFNPMMLMMLDSNKSNSSLLETMAMMSMMGGGNMFGNMSNMFGNMTTPVAPATAAPEPAVEDLVVTETTPVTAPEPTDFETIMKALSANPDLAAQLKKALTSTDKKNK